MMLGCALWVRGIEVGNLELNDVQQLSFLVSLATFLRFGSPEPEAMFASFLQQH